MLAFVKRVDVWRKFEKVRRYSTKKPDESEALFKTLFYAHTPKNPDCAIGSVARDELSASDAVVEHFMNLKHIESVEMNGKQHLQLTALGQMHAPINAAEYFKRYPCANDRCVVELFNASLLKVIESVPVFSDSEKSFLAMLNVRFKKNREEHSPGLVRKEVNRMSLDYIWKSCELEGGTYSIFDIDTLINYGYPAANKSFSEAQMVVNHMKALRFLTDGTSTERLKVLDQSLIEEAHMFMMEGTDIHFRVRKGRVGITGSNYRPPSSEEQLLNLLKPVLQTINSQEDVFSKALVTTLLLSYLQLFEDGNKRTARMISNAMLLNSGSFSLTYEGVSARDYKQAIGMFYERNSIYAFKELFLQQAEVSVNNYFA